MAPKVPGKESNIQSAAPAAPSLNVYRKIAVIRHSDDTLNYDDAEGNVKSVSITELGDAIANATPLQTPRPKLDIPVPRINHVKSYARDVPANYTLPRSYVRYHRRSLETVESQQDYIADVEDENWLQKNAKFGGAVATNVSETQQACLTRKPQLSLELFEQMMDLLEKATAFEAIITPRQAESLIAPKLPQLLYKFPLKAPPGNVQFRSLIQDVHSYWMHKRNKLKRPLLRQYWPITSTDDSNPHNVFRPRQGEKYKLRKKRQNDMDAFLKMKQLRNDFDNLRAIFDLVKRREELNRQHIHLQLDLFQQRIFDMTDTSELPRQSQFAKKGSIKHLLDIPTHFEVLPNGRKVRRILASNEASRNQPGLSGAAALAASRAEMFTTTTRVGNTDAGTTVNVAGRNNGEAAPLFMHPLLTRESYVSNWSGHCPHVTSYVDNHAQPTFRFRQRPRIGRGGRVCIDRVPQPMPLEPELQPNTILLAGRSLPYSTKPRDYLLDLLPRPLDYKELSRKIEMTCVAAIKEDGDARAMSVSGGNADAEENDGEEVVVKLDDWLQTDDQLWGEERYALGPI